MRVLSQSTGKPPVLVEKLVSKWWGICILSYLGALAHMSIIIQPVYNERTRVSENALLPALVTERFSYHQRISTFLKELQMESDLAGYIHKQLEAYGITAQTLRFTVTLPGFNQSGLDVVGVVRTSRSSSVEAILVAVSVSKKDLNSLAVALSLATYCREQIYWARDILFLFVDKGLTGMTAFLTEYHGRYHSFLRTEKLHFHSGAIVGAFAVKTEGSAFDVMNIEHNMINGLLPNLDLINLMVKLSDKYGLLPEVFNHGYQQSWWDIAETTSKAMLTQAFIETEGLHSVFGLYGIQAVTIHVKSVIEGHATLTDLARLCEGALRSLNNILEKFHQSYFLYILTNARHFLSLAYYMPALGFVLAPLLILALRDWFSLSEIKCPSSFALLHIVGIIQYCIIRICAESHLHYTKAVFLSFSAFIPFHLFFPVKKTEVVSLRFLFYLDYSLVFSALSLLNFSLAYIISLLAVPSIILITTVNIGNKLVNCFKMFGYMLHPLVIYLLCRYLFYGISPTKTHVEHLTRNFIKNHFLHSSFLFPFIFICLLPLWNMSILISSTVFRP